MSSSRTGGLEVIGHRGYAARAPENTLAALRAAADAGAPAVEFDVQVAACGTPVLFHDEHLGRTTNGAGPVRRRTLHQLQSLDAGRWFSDEFAGERIPSLEEALAAVGPRFARLYCEIKGYREMEDLDRIVAVARSSGYAERVVFISLDWLTLGRVASRSPELPVGYVVESRERLPEAVARATAHGNAFVDALAAILVDDPGSAASVLERQVELGVWTVNDVAEAEALRQLGVTRFTTDEVEGLLSWSGAGSLIDRDG
jgi:glycerophosphoryl diester phosphodiesterase